MKPAGIEPVESLHVRFWRHVEFSDGCWVWTGSLSKGRYGRAAAGRGRNTAAHRLAYQLLVGPIPKGLQLDHTCHNPDPTCPGGAECLHRRCVNPSHLEPVTAGENVRRSLAFYVHKQAQKKFGPSLNDSAVLTSMSPGRRSNRGRHRKTHCKRGHPLADPNLIYRNDGQRQCKACRDLSKRGLLTDVKHKRPA